MSITDLPVPPPPGGRRMRNSPVWSFATIVVLVAAAVILYLAEVDGRAAVLIGLIVSTLPSLVASLNAERAVRDIRNGVVEQKAKQGARAAIEEAQVMTRTGPVATTQLAALQQLLQEIHSTTSTTAGNVADIKATQEEAPS